MEIINLFRIKEGKNQGKFVDLQDLPAPDTRIENHIQVYPSMCDPKIRKKKEDLQSMGSIRDRMRISNMAKFPKEYKAEYCTEIDAHNWIPIDIQRLSLEENKAAAVESQKVTEEVKKEEVVENSPQPAPEIQEPQHVESPPVHLEEQKEEVVEEHKVEGTQETVESTPPQVI